MGWLGGGDFWMEDCGGVRGAGGPGFWLRVRAAATRPTSTGDCWRNGFQRLVLVNCTVSIFLHPGLFIGISLHHVWMTASVFFASAFLSFFQKE